MIELAENNNAISTYPRANMTLLQSLIRLIKPSTGQNQTQETPASGEMNPLGWYTSEEEKAWGDMEDAIGDSLDKVRIKERTRELIWRRGKKANRSLTLRQSIEHLHKLHPQYPIEEIQGFLISWMEECGGPENCSQEEMDDFDRSVQDWIEDELGRTENA